VVELNSFGYAIDRYQKLGRTIGATSMDTAISRTALKADNLLSRTSIRRNSIYSISKKQALQTRKSKP